MLVKSAVLAAALAALDGVSASLIQRQVLKDVDLAARIENNKASVGDKCHPPGTYALGGDKLIPPCFAEQGISYKCENLTDLKKDPENRKAYKKCMVGPDSSFISEVRNCLYCKGNNSYLSPDEVDWWLKTWDDALSDFIKDEAPNATLWNGYFQPAASRSVCPGGLKGWACYNQLTVGTAVGTAKTNKTVPIEEYYKNRPATQNIGSFELHGKKYPETTTRVVEDTIYEENGVPRFFNRSVVEYTSAAGYRSLVKFVGVTPDDPGQVTMTTAIHVLKSYFTFRTPDVFTIVSAVSPPVPLKDLVTTVPEKEASDLLTIGCNSACAASSMTTKDMEEVVIPGSKKVDDVVAKAATPALNELKEKDSLSEKAVEELASEAPALFPEMKPRTPAAIPSKASSPAKGKKPCRTRRRR